MYKKPAIIKQIKNGVMIIRQIANVPKNSSAILNQIGNLSSLIKYHPII